MSDPAPVLRVDCQWCGNRKHCVQYQALVLEPDGEYFHPGVCRVCPRCDSPGAAVKPGA